jgi:ATP synthase protein I
MAHPLPPEPPRPPEAPDHAVGAVSTVEPEDDGYSHVGLLQEPPARTVTGPRVRPGLRKRPATDETPMPARGAGMTIVSYLIAGIAAYGLIGWLIGRAVHVEILTAIGMLLGLGISMALIIYRYGRSKPPRIYRFAPKPAPQDGQTEQNADDNDARGTDR